MGRNIDILSGVSINNMDEGGSYDYYGYSRSEGSWVIMRKNSAGTELTYAVGGSDYSTAWTARASQSYKRADEFDY